MLNFKVQGSNEIQSSNIKYQISGEKKFEIKSLRHSFAIDSPSVHHYVRSLTFGIHLLSF